MPSLILCSNEVIPLSNIYESFFYAEGQSDHVGARVSPGSHRSSVFAFLAALLYVPKISSMPACEGCALFVYSENVISIGSLTRHAWHDTVIRTVRKQLVHG